MKLTQEKIRLSYQQGFMEGMAMALSDEMEAVKKVMRMNGLKKKEIKKILKRAEEQTIKK